MKILIVDDEPSVRKSIARLLKAGGHEVMEADNPSLAFQVVKENKDIGLVITDNSMPAGGEGLKFIERTRRYSSNLRIILVSGYMSDVLFDEAKLLGAEAAVNKNGLSDYLRKTGVLPELISA